MLISNSEISTFQTCERKHYYSFREALKPDRHNISLTRGIVGHEALEAFYKAKASGQPKDRCEKDLDAALSRAIIKYPEYARELAELRTVLFRYSDHYWDEPWKILEVESLHETPLLENSTVEYGLRLDLLVEVTAGIKKGQILVVDHKFVYNFFSDKEKQMNGQLAKYMRTLRHNGIPVRNGVLNQIRYRKLKEPKPDSIFRRDPIVSTDAELDRFWEEFKRPVKRLLELTELDQETHKRNSEMHIDKQTCGECAFQPLCKLWLLGQDETSTKRLLYKHNDYIDQYKGA